MRNNNLETISTQTINEEYHLLSKTQYLSGNITMTKHYVVKDDVKTYLGTTSNGGDDSYREDVLVTPNNVILVCTNLDTPEDWENGIKKAFDLKTGALVPMPRNLVLDKEIIEEASKQMIKSRAN